MLRGIRIAIVKTIILPTLLLACPCAMLAQRSAGGGRTGGALAGGGGLSGGNGKATGIDEKDDLKDFHAAMAVQATSQQIAEYNLMVKSTDKTGDEVRVILEQLRKPYNTTDLVTSSTALAEAVERTRAENKNFLEGFSDKQKAGLKEIIKKLLKDDSELAQKTKSLTVQAGDAKSAGSSIASTAEGLAHALDAFRSRQIGLGQEMNIGAGGGQDLSYNIPARNSSVSVENQPITITTSGVISTNAPQDDQTTFKLELTADISDLQQNISEILRRVLDRSDSCGEQIAIRSAILSPSAPAGLAEVRLHYERWACLGKGNPNEMVEGDGTIEIKLTPALGEGGALRLAPSIAHVDAQGRIGELLQSGSLGELVRDKVAESVLPIIQRSMDYKTMIPAAAQGELKLTHVQFEEAGAGKLNLVLDGDIQVPSDKVLSLTSELKAREIKGQPALAGTPR